MYFIDRDNILSHFHIKLVTSSPWSFPSSSNIVALHVVVSHSTNLKSYSFVTHLGTESFQGMHELIFLLNECISFFQKSIPYFLGISLNSLKASRILLLLPNPIIMSFQDFLSFPGILWNKLLQSKHSQLLHTPH